MLGLLPDTSLVAFVVGLAARLGQFCTLGALEDIYYGGNAERLRMWGIAIGMAILSTYGLSSLGYIDLSATLYLAVAWNPWANIFGGLLFGYGMALAGNCGYGALARLGGGDIRAFMIVMVMGLLVLYHHQWPHGLSADLDLWRRNAGSQHPQYSGYTL